MLITQSMNLTLLAPEIQWELCGDRAREVAERELRKVLKEVGWNCSVDSRVSVFWKCSREVWPDLFVKFASSVGSA